LAALTKIQLTTVRQPIPQIGTKGVELLIELIENNTQTPRSFILDTELIVRDSCGANLRQKV
ncbi:MAG: substrate-binding domain-containing protein, partial [Anaerolineaceae bacterium]|nr:substrate-binding domain-containing protein [Anaerolineaceae bacterium]